MKKIIIVTIVLLNLMQINASEKKTSSSEQKKMVQDFVKAVEEIPKKTSKNEKKYKESVEKMSKLYTKLSHHGDKKSIAKTEKKQLEKAARKLFDNKITNKK